MKAIRLALAGALLLNAACGGAASAPSGPTKSSECRFTEHPITLDGRGDETAWSGSRRGFLWDREYLYLLAENRGSDVFSILLTPNSSLYELRVDSAGKAELRLGEAELLRVEAATHRTADGWTLEGRIPWRAFLRGSGRPEPGDTWTLRTGGGDEALRFEGPPRTLRTSLLSSRVIGSPDPPLPFRTRPRFDSLKIPFPIAVAHEPGTRSLIVLHQFKHWTGEGRIVRISEEPDARDVEVLLSLQDVAYSVAFHPDYLRNGVLFVGSNGPMASKSRKSRVTRYRVDRSPPYRLDPASATLIVEWDSDGHNGGALAFGPDGYLYISSGDGSGDSDEHRAGQDLSRLLAKILRIDVDHSMPGRAYSVPGDNPFVNLPGARPETWAYGLRNPWRLTVDAKTGDLLLGNNGQDQWEQVYLIRRGENYGWSVNEGSHPFYPLRKAGPTPFTTPIAEHPHSEFRSLTGGLVYYGKRFPELQGAYIYGDWSTGRIWGLKLDRGHVTWNRELARTTHQITSFGTDSSGEIVITDHAGGSFHRLEPVPPDAALPPFPTRLSETGLFTSVAGHRVDPALIPYTVNAPLWSDGSYKERFIALPGAESRISYQRQRGWDFPDRSVLVKSFAIERVKGDASTRRWIETRLFTRQEGQWIGYSYAWNEAQTEATLVEAQGLDRDVEIQAADGPRKQRWHFPSRAECMMCHSRASNFVLGLTEPQMNRGEQLRELERLGVLQFDWTAETLKELKTEALARGLSEKDAEADVRRKTGPATSHDSALLPAAPERLGRLADPADPSATLDLRARSYLHANCAICHVEAGGGNAPLDLELGTSLEKTRLLDPPTHDSFGLSGARTVDILLQRISRRGRGQMPPLATSEVDEGGVRLLQEWAGRLPPPSLFQQPGRDDAVPHTEDGSFTRGIEGPACDREGNVYAVNFGKAGTIGKVTPDGRAELFVELPDKAIGNGIRFGPDGMMYVADHVGHRIFKVDPATRAVSVFVHEPRMSQPNDMAISPDGTLWASDPDWTKGTGRVWRIARDGSIKLAAEGLGTANGIETSPDGRLLYVNETVQRKIWAFDVGLEGALANKRLLIEFQDHGLDGMRCDIAGRLYVTRYGKGTVAVVSPEGKLLQEVGVLGPSPSNLCFGGVDGKTVYVTEVSHKRLVRFRTDTPGAEWNRWRSEK